MLGSLLKSLLFARRTPAAERCAPAADVAVVLQTVLRPSVLRAIRSVYEQDFGGRIHLLVGVDARLGPAKDVEKLLAAAPARVGVTLFDPGYSTSRRHGGIHTNHFGGSLRTLLSFAANAPHVAYLDDDDWYAPAHLSSLLAAVRGHDWAFTYRTFVNPYNLEPMCVDTLENMGPGAGVYAAQGGFACPSSLLLDKLACAPILYLWSVAGRPQGDAEDRMVFHALCEHYPSYGATKQATVNCVIKPEDGSHAMREKLIVEAGYPIERLRQGGEHAFGRI